MFCYKEQSLQKKRQNDVFQSFCRRDGGFLAEVETKGEDQFLISQITRINGKFASL